MKTAPTSHADGSPISIFYVDDDDVNLRLMELRLKKLNYQTDIALNGREAIEKLELRAKQGIKYNIIFMDVKMPIMNGVEALIELREKKYLIPIIMLTGYTSKKDHDEFLNLGADDVLTKPCSSEKIAAMLRKHLRV